MDPILKREIMLDNYENPMNRGLVDDDSYIKINTNNESCIDNLDIMYKIEDGKLVEIVEIKNHPYFIATQFHPEFKSRPDKPHPLFTKLIKATLLN